MMINELIVLVFGLVIAVTILLMFRRIFFGKRANLKINKKVNSRELFEPLDNEPADFQDDNVLQEEETIQNSFNESHNNTEASETSESLFVINLESGENKISYNELISFLEEVSSNYSNEGGWFRVFSDDHFFSLVNGLNPGKFDTSIEDDETSALTLILSPISGANTISNFHQMVTFAELLASKLNLNLYDSDRNPLTQQMIDHYSHLAEDFDLRNFA
ncbi:MAG: cell division protein ZipA C-terminal FtsZ-binding domain-containing protein [Gammaproteobacteria bacterium]